LKIAYEQRFAGSKPVQSRFKAGASDGEALRGIDFKRQFDAGMHFGGRVRPSVNVSG